MNANERDILLDVKICILISFPVTGKLRLR